MSLPPFWLPCYHPSLSSTIIIFKGFARKRITTICQSTYLLTRRHSTDAWWKLLETPSRLGEKQEETRIIFYLTCMSRLLTPCQIARTIKLKNTISYNVSHTKIIDIPCFKIKSMEVIKLQIRFSYNYYILL